MRRTDALERTADGLGLPGVGEQRTARGNAGRKAVSDRVDQRIQPAGHYGIKGDQMLRRRRAVRPDTCEDKQLSDTLYDVLDTPVSPELLPPEDGKISQKTEDLVGPYELHDFFLYYMLRQGFSPAKIYRLAKIAFAGTYEAAFILKWLKTFCRRFFAQQFKRSCLPDGPKVGSVAVSPRGDLRMPSDACATLWMEELNTLS